jgi:hypothetical protein
MLLLQEKITVADLNAMSQRMFGNLVKAVVDIKLNRLVVDAELHADQEAFLLQNGSEQKDLWGINIYPEFSPDDPAFIEFDSMINLRPSQGNKSRGVEDPSVRQSIISIVRSWIA